MAAGGAPMEQHCQTSLACLARKTVTLYHFTHESPRTHTHTHTHTHTGTGISPSPLGMLGLFIEKQLLRNRDNWQQEEHSGNSL